MKLSILLALLLLISQPPLFAQVQHPMVRSGIDDFYAARFDQATTILMEVIEEKDLNKVDLFHAYLYLAFSLVRNNAPEEAIAMAFEGCVRLDPSYALDTNTIPPDLINRFEKIRAEMVGGLYVVSNPREASVLGAHTETNLTIMGKTPVLFERRLAGEYNLLLSKESYRDYYMNAIITSSHIDTLYLTLEKEVKPVHKRWWPWAGGIVVLAALVSLVMNQK